MGRLGQRAASAAMRMVFAAASCMLVAAPAIAGGLTAADLAAMKRLGEPAISPDATRVVYSLREPGAEPDDVVADLWMITLDDTDGEPRRLTRHTAAEHAPQWSADGSQIYFLADRTGTTQVWALPLAGGEAQPVTALPVSVSSFRISPTGRHVVFTAESPLECGADLGCAAERLAAGRETGPRVYDRLFIRHWDAWKRNARSRLFALPLDGGKTAREPVLLSAGLDADVPAVPFGDRSDYVISGDGRRVIFSARVAGDGEAWSTNFDLYSVDMDGDDEPVNLTADNPGADTHPLLTRDGRTLIYLSMRRGGFEADRRRVLRRELRAGRVTELAPAWDRSPGSLALGPNDDFVYAIAQDTGQRGLFRIPLEGGGAFRLPTQAGTVRAVAVGRDEPPAAPVRVVYALDSLTRPTDLFELVRSEDPETGTEIAEVRRLTDVNAQAIERIDMAGYEQFRFDGWNDETVHGYVMRPVDARPGARYPVAFLIHGGPQGSFGNEFHYRWNPQAYAGAGYAAVFIDFHGSTGYGQAFTDSITGDWGGKPLVDLQKGLDAALERYPWLDGDRVCALGASYGGYMVNWIAGNWPDRFRCLVNHDGIFDNRMMYYTTEELWFPEWEFGGPQFRVPLSYERHNPVNHVDSWQTPMLVIHGALDFRVPETQGMAAFTALQRRGIESRFVYFPTENHWVLAPSNSIEWHAAVLDWLATYLAR